MCGNFFCVLKFSRIPDNIKKLQLSFRNWPLGPRTPTNSSWKLRRLNNMAASSCVHGPLDGWDISHLLCWVCGATKNALLQFMTSLLKWTSTKSITAMLINVLLIIDCSNRKMLIQSAVKAPGVGPGAYGRRPAWSSKKDTRQDLLCFRQEWTDTKAIKTHKECFHSIANKQDFCDFLPPLNARGSKILLVLPSATKQLISIQI